MKNTLSFMLLDLFMALLNLLSNVLFMLINWLLMVVVANLVGIGLVVDLLLEGASLVFF